MVVYRFIAYLKFLFRSTNQHGVHSPFVYDFVTRCLYTKPSLSKEKSIDVLLKTIAYFGISKLKIHENWNIIKQQIQESFPSAQFDSPPFDLIYMEEINQKFLLDYAIGQTKKTHNDTVIFIDNIHGTARSSARWNDLIGQREFTATLDLFHCGLLFYRKEQVKEHFRIRI